MLKAGSVKCKTGCEAWPRPVKPASSSSTQSRECQNNNSDAEDYQQVPRYEALLSDAIQAALDSYDQTTGNTIRCSFEFILYQCSVLVCLCYFVINSGCVTII